MSAKTDRKHGRTGPLIAVVLPCLVVGLLLAVPIQLNAQHVEGGGWRDNALPKLLDAAGAGISTMGRKVCATPSELGQCGGESWAVVHDRPVIREDDGNAVGRLRVIACRPHGSVGVVAVDGDVRMLKIVFVALKLGWHPFSARAIAALAGELAGCGIGDGDDVVAGNILPLRLSRGEGGADVVRLVAVESVEGEFDDLGNWLCGGGHGRLVVGGLVSRVVQLRTLYTVTVYPQDKFTLFLCRLDSRSFSPHNAGRVASPTQD